MRKRKIVLIAALNILLIVFCIFLSDVCIYLYQAKIHPSFYTLPPFHYQIDNLLDFNQTGYFDGADNVYRGRKPDGLEYEGAEPIVLFGCSFAHGQHLNPDETFSYRLAHSLKRPVYNRAVPGRGIQHMLYQSEQDLFYEEVPPADTVIFVMLSDHYRRMKAYHSGMLDYRLTGNYKVYKGFDLILKDHKNPLKNFIKSLYTVKLLNQKYVNWYIYNPKNAETLTDETLMHFIWTRHNLERRWGKKVNFIVLIYDNTAYEDMLKEKLQKYGFKVYLLEKDVLPGIDFGSAEYIISEDNAHPNAEAWKIITPEFIEKAGLKKYQQKNKSKK